MKPGIARSPIRVIDDIRAFGVDDSVGSWLRRLAGPSSFRIFGRDRSRCRAVCTLLHGNEPSGIRAVHGWLRSQVAPETDVIFYVGSVAAALTTPIFSHRLLPGSRDANRTFAEPFEGPEGVLSSALLDLLAQAKPEALVDIHNNSGHSPAYGVGMRADSIHLALTALFADRYMLSDLRLHTLVEAADRFAPSVVVECGRAGDPVADAVALAGLDRFLSVEELHDPDADPPSMRILHRPIRVTITTGLRVAFGEAPLPGVDLTLRQRLDRHNFETVDKGVVIGWLGAELRWPFEARGGDGVEVSRQLFEATGGALVTRRAMVPIMMTGSTEMAKLDCLFYALERR
jgi:hypothetical protein